VLIALVLWSSIWGVCGAILSVPLLGVMKMLQSTIREDANVDEHQLMATMLKQLPSYQVRKTLRAFAHRLV
jgi:predicted PurR-regulated permease PerM